ncbi:tRNA (adenosine(37)-N6)-threonylcarbamoyltransferase complex ATPase subunit type 1 TsaE [Flavobacterium caeni]|uniref:tRNA threonylcarbamoyladenosine biosynthesis protein TsaE n=1 Tax=Flavobacterium caeni TaxID=490189 RepID=A0A1G5CZF7_9FLAO|nr:tRNA (adenosine(37)-N6)-threonylcarbamoyltransferase complex ATPase subunit type 1 TsaE [Flavobacterium caeni]SCY07825.1 tRNA threonylcarbamoyladenosine biosynthesis protein TsaE [Flavobacterium caeni]
MEIIFSLNDIHDAAKQVRDAQPYKVITFNGAMGAGKTTFINALVKSMGVNDTTGSPTFSLVNEYRTADNQIVYHFDVYRLKSESEAYDMGMDEYLYSDHWCLIEWAEKIPNLLPEVHSTIDIEALPDGRRKLTLR